MNVRVLLLTAEVEWWRHGRWVCGSKRWWWRWWWWQVNWVWWVGVDKISCLCVSFPSFSLFSVSLLCVCESVCVCCLKWVELSWEQRLQTRTAKTHTHKTKWREKGKERRNIQKRNESRIAKGQSFREQRNETPRRNRTNMSMHYMHSHAWKHPDQTRPHWGWNW